MHGDIGEMKKWIISLTIILILCGIRFTDPWFLDIVRMKALDQHQRNQTQESLSNLVTVEINNETLKKKDSGLGTEMLCQLKLLNCTKKVLV